jgi:predicted dehydrogenase
MEPVRCALVGLGMIGTEHASILQALPDGELVVVVDTDAERASLVPEGVRFTTDLDEALATPGLEAVYVCTPQHVHRPVVEAALAQGLAVFSEKPFAASIEDADAMMAAAAQASGSLVIGHTLRFHPDYIAVHRAVVAGEVGQPVQLAARWNAPDYEGRIISGRTTVPLEMCIHDLDILRWLAGEIDTVYAEASSIAVTGPGPDAIAGTVRFASGAVAALDHSWIGASATGFMSDHRLAVYGTGGSAFVEMRDTPAVIYGSAGPKFVNSMYRTSANGIPFGALAAEDAFFLAMVRDGRAWPLTLDDARAALVAALALDEAIRLGRPVRTSEIG